jgi:hypothetical protein
MRDEELRQVRRDRHLTYRRGQINSVLQAEPQIIKPLKSLARPGGIEPPFLP